MIINENERIQASRKLASRLRHRPGDDERGLPIAMDRAGWVLAGDILAAGLHEGWLVDDVALMEVVSADTNGRFEFSADSWDEDEVFRWDVARLRACSGHSLDVDLGLEEFRPEGELFFGTVEDRADRIAAEGLTRGTKLRTRLLQTEAAALDVAVRRGCSGPAVFAINAVAMHVDGHSFQMASNGEILGPKVPAAYVRRVEMAPSVAP